VHNVKNLGGALVFISHFVFLDHPTVCAVLLYTRSKLYCDNSIVHTNRRKSVLPWYDKLTMF